MNHLHCDLEQQEKRRDVLCGNMFNTPSTAILLLLMGNFFDFFD